MQAWSRINVYTAYLTICFVGCGVCNHVKHAKYVSSLKYVDFWDLDVFLYR